RLKDAGALLAGACDVFVAVETAENTEIYVPSQSRIAVLAVVDMLATALMARLGPPVLERLRRAKLSVQEARAGDARAGAGARARGRGRGGRP
ncbi:MAG: hypothetical protein ACO3CC_17660, partial [Alphaproteobacteria bacterium]